jgi:hypothetical protein
MDTHALMGQIDALEMILVPLANNQPKLVFEVIQLLRSNMPELLSVIESRSKQPLQHKAGFYAEISKIEKICTDLSVSP